MREIGAAVGLCSPASVQGHSRALEARATSAAARSKRRALEVVRGRRVRDGRGSRGTRSRGCPLVGRVAAGQPLLAEENIEESIDIPAFLGEPEECFALRVDGHLHDQGRHLRW